MSNQRYPEEFKIEEVRDITERGLRVANVAEGLRPVSSQLVSPLPADSVEKVGLAAAGRSNVPAVEVAGSHFKLPFGVSLSFFAQV